MKKSVTHVFFLSELSHILELFPFYKITLKSHICIVVTIMGKQCWSQAVLESGSWGHSVLQTPALVFFTDAYNPLTLKAQITTVGLGGSIGCAVRLETRRSRYQPPPRSATFFRGD